MKIPSNTNDLASTPVESKQGYTLTEVLVASSLGSLVLIAVLVTFIWCAQQATVCSKSAWSQEEAMHSSFKLQAYLRNAVSIVQITNRQYSTTVRLRMPDKSVVALIYTNSPVELRNGKLYLQRTNGTEMLVARGMTGLQDANGGTIPIFSMVRTNVLRVAYRVAEPISAANSADDGLYAASVRFAACLRNAPE
jgi:prepilin-type N-terminal cleavage/methylation domain-containing protein